MPGWRDLARYSALSACLVGFFWGMFSALRHTSVLNTATIYTLTPVITAAVFGRLAEGKAERSGADRPAVRHDRRDLGDLSWRPGGADFAQVRARRWDFFRGHNCDGFLCSARQGSSSWRADGSNDVLDSGDRRSLAAHAVSTTFVRRRVGAQYRVWSTPVSPTWRYLRRLSHSFAIQWSTTVIGPTKVMSYTYLNPALVLLIGLALGPSGPTGRNISGICPYCRCDVRGCSGPGQRGGRGRGAGLTISGSRGGMSSAKPPA